MYTLGSKKKNKVKEQRKLNRYNCQLFERESFLINMFHPQFVIF